MLLIYWVMTKTSIQCCNTINWHTRMHMQRENDTPTHTLHRQINRQRHTHKYTCTHNVIHIYTHIHTGIYIYITHQLVRILLQFLLCQYHRRPTVTQGIRVPVNTAHNIQWAPCHQRHCTSHLPHHHHTYTACVNSDIYGATIGANNNVNLSDISVNTIITWVTIGSNSGLFTYHIFVHFQVISLTDLTTDTNWHPAVKYVEIKFTVGHN